MPMLLSRDRLVASVLTIHCRDYFLPQDRRLVYPCHQ